MLWAVFAVFFLAWVLALVGVYTIGAWLWLLFAIWVIALFVQLLLPRRRSAPPAAS